LVDVGVRKVRNINILVEANFIELGIVGTKVFRAGIDTGWK
jgi:hypothetical protein